MSELQVTQCPYCKTHFRLSQEQLSAAAGNVRCGACLKVFNALSTNPAQSPPAAPIERHNAAGELLIHDDLELDDLDLEALGLDESIVEEVNPPLSASRDEARLTADDSEPGLSAADDDFLDDDQPLSLAETALPQEPTDPQQPGALDDDDFDLHEDFIATPPARDIQQRREPAFSEPDPLPSKPADALPPPARMLPLQDATGPGGIFLRDRPANVPEDEHAEVETGLTARDEPDIDEAELDDVPEDNIDTRSEPRLDDDLTLPDLDDEPLLLDEPVRAKRRGRHNWIWTPLCLLAIGALLAQIVTYNLEAWARDERWRPTLEGICLVAGCELPVRVDISQVRSSNLLVRPHPDFPNAVAIDVIIYNRADYPQPFPVVRMLFTDNRGNSVSEKRFRPEEYLGGELAGRNLMPPQTPIHIALSMVAPGPQASSYNLDFLSP
ncbi:MJ0042 family finger-like domain-containing protein [Halopseudomonas sabulinigri]|uniref:MJ0042 family finger-like domain-containing protein n=1 Tax=Halopseudomonas sabulinigri TaxID=472181 RepID=A0A1H1QK98_9GAMM|nr:zinc-ribbon and DUF3426 domain-containing protein [Halopseudomonas sabulinigri]SDS23892.1 MJ0042 family finger-like domain-containing protein [Halopseudomonas sabulinigri]